MRRLAALLVGLLLLSGCAPNAREPADLALVRVLGVDGGGPVTLTAVCGGGDREELCRGACTGGSFQQAKEGLPWSGREELSLTSVSYLLVGPDTASGLVPDSVLRLARRFGIPVDTLFRGDTVWLADGLKLDVLWPPEYGRFGENGASVVMKVALEDDSEKPSLLLTGDLESAGERRLLELSPSLSADLLQVPHHGSAGSSTLRFLSRVSPRYAVIGVGRNNRYGHPTAEVLQKLRYVTGDSAAVFRTDLHGTVSFGMWPGIGVVMP